MEEQPAAEPSERSIDSEEISQEDIAKEKRQARINALLLGAVFLLTVTAPRPWNTYAPLLLLIPFLYAIVKKVREATSGMDPMQQRTQIDFGGNGGRHEEPYSYTPRDPSDPRRYKPIE